MLLKNIINLEKLKYFKQILLKKFKNRKKKKESLKLNFLIENILKSLKYLFSVKYIQNCQNHVFKPK